MTADGNWDLVVSTPIGERRAILSLSTQGTTLKGRQMADGTSAEIFDGSVNDAAIAWKVSITDPMPMTLQFSGTINGDELTGNVTLGAFGTSPFSGTRT